MNVTAIICVHDDLTWLPEALSSVRSQTTPVQEIILVKSKETPLEVEALASAFGVKTAMQDAPGLAAARNLGAELAAGELLAFLDCDDVWEAEKTSLQLQQIREAALDAVTGSLLRFPADPAFRGNYSEHHFFVPVPALTPGGLLIKKTAFDRVGFFDTEYRIACDHEWFMRLTSSQLCWQKSPEVVLRKRIHANNLSNSNAEYRREIMEILANRHK